MRRFSLSCAVVLVLLGLASPAHAATAATPPPLPSSMASTGDSITRGYDATLFGCFLADCPQYSWSTGTSSSVLSQYRRILAANPAISGHQYNDAKTGATMSALPGQMQTAATQGADYVTVLMGANDLCTSSASTMTPTATFQGYVQQALAAYLNARPGGHIFVSSIPNIYQLWSLLHTTSAAASTWKTFGICQSMLSSSNTEAQRQLVVTREQQFNAVLAQECGLLVPSCLWDGGATYNYAFVKSDVSTVDYFHPSVSGQNKLAALTWSASYWPAS
jgi:lysophospholipase L1-like esterase